MRLPWFPYPRCWARTLIGVNSIAMSAVVVFIVVVLFGGLAGLVSAVTRGLGIVMIIPLIGMAIVGPVFLHAHVRQLVATLCKLFRSESLSWEWNPQRQFWIESLVDFAATLGSAFVVGGFYMIVRSQFVDIDEPLREAEETFLSGTWGLAMLYIHQVRYLVLEEREKKRKRMNRQKNRSTLPRAKRPVRPVQDSDRELNEVRRQQSQKQQRRVTPPSPPPSRPPSPPPQRTANDEVDLDLELLRQEMKNKKDKS